MKKASLSLVSALIFFLAGTASEGPACASLDGRPSCCRQCPMKMLPKVGNSCCSQGVERGYFGPALLPSFERPIFLGNSISSKNENEISQWLEDHLSHTPETVRIYLSEEHLLL